MRRIIAIDFDGCICEENWPGVGRPNLAVIRDAKAAKAEGAALILWTCREGDDLEEAIEYCSEFGLTFDAVNDNLPHTIDHFGNNCRKIVATEYWDDRAVNRSYRYERRQSRNGDLN